MGTKDLAVVLVLALTAPSLTTAQSLADDPGVSNALRLLEVWLDAQQAYEDIPGLSMAVVHDQGVLWKGAFGYADRARQAQATPQTMYSICSISKLFTSIGVMQLRDQGVLRLDDAVGDHLSWFDIKQVYPESPPIAIERVLTHSAGLPRESDYPYWSAPDYHFPTREQVIERVSSQETLYPSAKYYQYSNLGLTLAGEVVAAASGMPYADYVQRNILDPLGMGDTSPEIPKEQQGKRFAMGYGAQKREGERSELTFFQVRGIAPAAGFASTVEDLAKFASWQFRLLGEGGKEVLSANTLREMQRVHWLDPDWETTRGLGFSIWRTDEVTFVGHGGGCPGFRSHFMLQTDEKFAAIVMTNAIDINSNKFTRVAYDIVGPAIAKAVASSADADEYDYEERDFEMYTGSYDIPWVGEGALVPWKDGLAMVFLPSNDPMDGLTKLKHTGEHTFRRIRDDGELGEEIVFEVGDDGEVVRLKWHSNYYNRVR